MLRLPQKVMSLDIETFLHKKGEIPRCFLVGYNLYDYQPNVGYLKEGYYFYEEEKINQDLANLLNNFEGLIIGHNLWGFDYKVLAKYINIEKAKTKTCDTLQILRQLGHKEGLSLNNLAKLNFGSQKTLLGQEAGKLWLNGKKQMVLAYNEKDCDLSMRLWTYLLREQSFSIKEGVVVKLSVNEVQDLIVPRYFHQKTAAPFFSPKVQKFLQ